MPNLTHEEIAKLKREAYEEGYKEAIKEVGRHLNMILIEGNYE